MRAAVERGEESQRERRGGVAADEGARAFAAGVAHPDNDDAGGPDGGAPGIAVAAAGAGLPSDVERGCFGTDGGGAADVGETSEGGAAGLGRKHRRSARRDVV